MWIDKFTLLVLIILVGIGVVYTINLQQKKHEKESKELREQIEQLRNDKRTALDNLYIKMKNEKQQLVEKELIFCFKYSREEARRLYDILNCTVMIEEFFSAITLEERQKVVDESLLHYERLPEHLKSEEIKTVVRTTKG